MAWSLMMTAWQGFQLVTREVKLSGPISFGDHLRDSATLDVAIEPGQPFWASPMQLDYWARVLLPCKDGTPYGAFVFTAHGWDSDADQITIHGDRVDAVLMRRLIRHDMQFANVDQNRIVRDLMRYGMGQSTLYTLGGPVTPHYGAVSEIPWWTVTQGLSGVKRDRLITPGNDSSGYVGDERKTVGEEIKNILGLGGEPGAPELPGPELRHTPYLDPTTGDPRLLTEIGYPRVGNPDPGRILIDHPGRNVIKASFGGDGTQMATWIEVGGQVVDGQARPFGAAANNGLMASGTAYLAKAYSESSVSTQSNLTDKAVARLAGSGPQTGWEITLDSSTPPRFGLDYHVGDFVTLRITQAGVRQPDAVQRIVGYKVVADGDSETVQLILGDV